MDFTIAEQLLSEDQARFTITNDAEAEWAAKKIREHEAERDRLVDTAKVFIAHYQEQINRIQSACARDTAFLLSHLEAYFATVAHKEAKTQETYRLPSYKLKLKRQEPDYDRDNEELLAWARSTNDSEKLVRVKEEPAWDAIKKSCLISGNQLVYEATGEIVPGVTVKPCPPIFTIENV